MADKITIINPPQQPSRESGGGAGWPVAIIIIVLIVLFLVFGLSWIRNRDGGDTKINIPDKIKIESNQY